MNLLSLPEEILIEIVRKLDTKSVMNLYKTCTHMKNIIGLDGVIKVCNFSLSTAAKLVSFESTFFDDIAGHLNKLNLCCFPDLNKAVLLNVAPKLTSLKILDVSYTIINISNLFDICDLCPTLNDISINFDFGRTSWPNIPKQILEKYQSLFKNFKHIHFVGNFESLYYSNLLLVLLQTAKLDKLELTITDCNLPAYDNCEGFEKMCDYQQIKVYLLNWKNKPESYTNFDNFFLASALDVNQCEFIVIVWLNVTYRAIYVTSIFMDFFKKKFNIQAECLAGLTPNTFGGDVALLVWNKESTVFDVMFYDSLYHQLISFFPHHHESIYGTSVMPAGCDWLYVTQFRDLDSDPDPETHMYNQVLNFDAMTTGKESLKLTIQFQNMDLESYVTLPPQGQYLSKVTYIDLDGLMYYCQDFFPVLFTCCTKLQTLSMSFDDEYNTSAIDDVTKTLPLSSILRNFRLVSPCLELQSIFSCLSKCIHLENIHLVDKFSDPQPVSLCRAIFEKCPNLYNYSLSMEMTPDVLKRNLQILHNFRLEYGRHHLNIELYATDRYSEYSYDPYIGIFNLSPLKPN